MLFYIITANKVKALSCFFCKVRYCVENFTLLCNRMKNNFENAINSVCSAQKRCLHLKDTIYKSYMEQKMVAYSTVSWIMVLVPSSISTLRSNIMNTYRTQIVKCPGWLSLGLTKNVPSTPSDFKISSACCPFMCGWNQLKIEKDFIIILEFLTKTNWVRKWQSTEMWKQKRHKK